MPSVRSQSRAAQSRNEQSVQELYADYVDES